MASGELDHDPDGWALGASSVPKRPIQQASQRALCCRQMAFYFRPRGELLAKISGAHSWLYDKSRGWVGARLVGMDILLLHSRGAKTGIRRTAPLPYFRTEAGIVVVASNAAQPSHPAWYYNVRAEPEVELQLKRERFAARARVLGGEERRSAWAAIVAVQPRYAHYQALTEREIPLIAFEPKR